MRMGDCEECIEERRRQSVYSPGTVRDDESLARFVSRSEHFSPDGELDLLPFLYRTFQSHTVAVSCLRD